MANSAQYRLLPATSIINRCSDGTLTGANNYFIAALKKTVSGALSAGTYKELIALTGSGVLNACLVCNNIDTTSRQIGLKVVIDGTTVFDAYSEATTTANVNLIAIGTAYSSILMCTQDIVFAQSLSIQIKSSLDETDKLTLGYSYYLT